MISKACGLARLLHCPESARGARSIRARAGAVAGAKVYAVKMEPGAEASTCAYASCYAWLQRAVSSETMYKLAALTTGAQHT